MLCAGHDGLRPASDTLVQVISALHNRARSDPARLSVGSPPDPGNRTPPSKQPRSSIPSLPRHGYLDGLAAVEQRLVAHGAVALDALLAALVGGEEAEAHAGVAVHAVEEVHAKAAAAPEEVYGSCTAGAD